MDLMGDGVEYIFNKEVELIEEYFGKDDKGQALGEQEMPGFNVY